MYFCIRDDDTSFFTTPDDLENAYGSIGGPVSLAVIPFCQAGWSAFVPKSYQHRWTVHPLHDNSALVNYLRTTVSQGRFEVMLHGYYHDVRSKGWEFSKGPDLFRRMSDGRKYLEDLIGAPIRVFVPPMNGIGRTGLCAIVEENLHLAGAAGVRGGWNPLSPNTWKLWLRLRRWREGGGHGIPWILDLGDHCEIPGNPVTPEARLVDNDNAFNDAESVDGSFCLATHYWEFGAPSEHQSGPNVKEHVQHLVDRALRTPRVHWRSVGDTVSEAPRLR